MLPGFTLREIILLTNLVSTLRQTPPLTGQTNKRIMDTKVIESEISIGELVAKLSPLFVKNFSGYLDYYSPTPKVIITLTRRAKLANVRATLNTGAEVSVITLDAAKRFKILVTHSLGMALWTIISNKSRFVGFVDNVLVTISNTVVRTWFYIMDCLGIKVILGFLFIQKARVTFRYPRDKEDRLVFVLLYNLQTREITSIKTNIKTKRVRDSFLNK